MSEPEAKEPVVHCITADKIGDTGAITWQYMFAEGIPRDFQSELMGKLWGYCWIPDRRDVSYSFNLFESGKGLKVGGGWTPKHDDDKWNRKVAEELGDCSMLMSTEVFDWLKENIFDKFGIKFERWHSDKPILTN